MKKPLNLSNSIYQQKGAGYGLGMSGGMQINNRPDSTTGIQQAVAMKKMLKRAEKVSLMSEAVALGTMRGDDCCMG